ncbi:MAG: hypothetical protein K9G33_02370 [Sneathiella sp.]|nr:hypothetical protein [Sneathiella sp.]
MRDEEEMMKIAVYRSDIQAALERVAEQMDFIEAASTVDNDGDEPMQRVTVTLPQSVVHLARFLAVMDTELMPASLRLWNFSEGKGAKNRALQRNINTMMRRYLSDEIKKQLFAELNRLHNIESSKRSAVPKS